AKSGGIHILAANTLTVGTVSVTVQRAMADGSVTTVTDAAQSDVVTTGGNGTIVLRTLAGNLNLTDGTAPADGVAVSAHGSGNVLLKAGGAVSDLIVNAGVRSGSGNITLLAGRNVGIGGISVTTGGAGTIDIEAVAGSISVADGGSISAADGTIRLRAPGDVVLSGIRTGGDVSVTSVSGSILDGGDTFVDVAANGLRLSAGVEI